MTLTQRTLQSPYTAKTLVTLTKHAQSPQGIDTVAALRLLRRNVRGVAPRATHHQQTRVATEILRMFRSQIGE